MILNLDTDYLIIGAGAMGMAFADELIHQNPHLRVILVDRRAKPGGHWNDAYRFVTLHQPALFYGVNSEPLGSGGEDLASGAEIQAYYERVLHKLVATGRLTFFGQCDYLGGGRFRSLVSPDQTYTVSVGRKTVDATYSQMRIPSTHPPAYGVAEGIHLVPINALAGLQKPWSRYVVIGAGKTGMDAILFLLNSGVEPDRIQWIISNDAWFFKRWYLMPERAARVFPDQLRCLAEIKDTTDFYEKYEARGWLFRLDKNIWPTRFRCATVSQEELDALRALPHKIRMGRVKHITSDQIVLEQGTVPTDDAVLHIDCTADGLVQRPKKTVFAADKITLQPLAMCQQVFSAAMTAMIELRFDDDTTKNAMAKPIPHPVYPNDQLICVVDSVENIAKWMPSFGWTLLGKRLGVVHHMSWFSRLRLMVVALLWFKKTGNNLVRVIESIKQEP